MSEPSPLNSGHLLKCTCEKCMERRRITPTWRPLKKGKLPLPGAGKTC